jgi:hypothetical protein
MTGLEVALTVVAGVLTGILSAVFGTGGGRSRPFMILVLGSRSTSRRNLAVHHRSDRGDGSLGALTPRCVRWRPAAWLGVAGLGGAVGRCGGPAR